MQVISTANAIISLLIGLTIILSGGIATFFIIRSQLTKTLKEEVEAYKGKVQRLQEDILDLQKQLSIEIQKNHQIKNERDYLKSIVVEAITTEKTIQRDVILKAARKMKSK